MANITVANITEYIRGLNIVFLTSFMSFFRRENSDRIKLKHKTYVLNPNGMA